MATPRRSANRGRRPAAQTPAADFDATSPVSQRVEHPRHAERHPLDHLAAELASSLASMPAPSRSPTPASRCGGSLDERSSPVDLVEEHADRGGGIATDRHPVGGQRVPGDRVDLERLAVDVVLAVEHPRSLQRHRRHDEVAPSPRTDRRWRSSCVHERVRWLPRGRRTDPGPTGRPPRRPRRCRCAGSSRRVPPTRRRRAPRSPPGHLVVRADPLAQGVEHRNGKHGRGHGPNLSAPPILTAWHPATNS
jgi:hypothetical protein